MEEKLDYGPDGNGSDVLSPNHPALVEIHSAFITKYHKRTNEIDEIARYALHAPE
jgi:hypothetical protein